MKSLKAQRIIQLLRLIFADVVATMAALTISYFSTIDFVDLPVELLVWGIVNVGLIILVFSLFELYSVVFDYIGIIYGLKIVGACSLISVANICIVLLTHSTYANVWTVLVFGICMIFFTICTRYFSRSMTVVRRYFSTTKQNRTRVAIVGGGSAASIIIREMENSEKMAYEPVFIVDDDHMKLNQFVGSVKIVGEIAKLPEFVKKLKIQEIFVCIPTATKIQRERIVEICKSTGKTVKILPGIYQIASGQISVGKMRDVDIEDLLGRDQVNVNVDEIMGYIEGRCVLITGGGGSIGSELCRQIAYHNPSKLIIFDIYENNAYDIEQELKRKYTSLNLLVLIGSIRDKAKVEWLFATHKPDIVFHAAAHKHVPLMESSPNEAVKNNVFGTLNVAQCADKYGAETFVQISTDKAVNPTNVMGATKRICEMIVQTIGRNSKHTKFVAVRFGNVLGSNGSVIPLFKQQIAEGGPVTVTHKDIIRYFMTIPEAVSLVLQAGAYAQSGQIFVLDMGEPVKIYDLAQKLVKLSGFEPNVDIEIKCTGLRPGEKLYEERLMIEEGLQKTSNGLISIAKPIDINEKEFWGILEKLFDEAHNETDKMKELVKELVPTYKIDKR